MRLKAYWHQANQGPNFGDVLTPWLLAKHGIQAVWSQPRKAVLFGVGSIAAKIPAGFTGWVWGTGKLKATRVRLEQARVLAVRGPYTWDADLYADPGLLAGLYTPETEKRYPVGVISHYIDPLPDAGHRINILDPIPTVIGQAAQCKRIISNSLHGLILADSLGIPNRWVYSEKVIGEGFKFRDYAASFGETIEPDVWRLAPQDQVAGKQSALVKGLENVC